MSATTRQLDGSSHDVRPQLLFRELNEQLRSLARSGELGIVCECVNGSCYERLHLPLDAYEAVRRFPARFVVKEGHVADDLERQVESRDGYVVIEKTGADAEHAILLDPRRKTSRRPYPTQHEHQPSRQEASA